MTLQRRLGGPAAFSLPVWIVVCATSLLALALASDLDLSTTNGTIRGVIAFLVGAMLAFVGLVLLWSGRQIGKAQVIEV